MDYCKLSALLGAWDDASLSAEEERELEACVSDSDYEILAAEADAFISSLAAGEKNARRRPQWGVWLSAAAACVAVMAVAVWLFIPGSGTENATQMAAVETVKPTETVKIQDDYKDSAPAPVPASVVPRKAYAHRQICVVAEQPEDTAPVDQEDAWATFLSMREEMADVVNADHGADIRNEITDAVTPGILTEKQDITIDVYGSLKDASEILNSILCEL